MSNSYFGFHTRTLLVASVLLLPGLSAPAANSWTNTASALWRSPTNWSLATAPSSTSAADPTQITNAVTKTVTIDSATAAANLFLRGLTLSAPAGSTNTLGLLNIPLSTPLTTSKPLLVGSRAVLAITNSAVSATASFDIVDGSLILNSGSLVCAANCDLQSGNMTVNAGTLTATAGTTGIRMGRFSGANASFAINGGTITTLRATLGSVSGSQNTLLLSGGNLICNEYFSAAQLHLTTGNVTMTSGNLIVTNGTTFIADRGDAIFSQSGGSASFADVRIGDVGVGTYNLTGGQFIVTARTTNDFAIIGNHGDGTFNQTGGITVLRGELHVSDFAGDLVGGFPPSVGNLNITGGQFFATNDLVVIGRYSLGQMTVSNATVVLTNTSVGRHDTGVGTLTIQSGGNVFLIADLSIGRLTNSTGHVFINGGLLSLTNDDLWVGRDGTGDLTVSDGVVRAKSIFVGMSEDQTNTPAGGVTLTGGTTLIASNLTVGTSLLSTGQVAMAGGTLAVTNAGGTANLIVAQGAFTFDSGSVEADQVLLTNESGQFTFHGGLLRAKNMTVANGVPFTVGDGVNSAILELQGGVYNFANGLVISPNAMVTGCGTVIGIVVNNGTYNNSCGGTSPSPTTISAASKSSNTVTLSCASQNGSSYTLEYKDSLTDPVWTPILPATPGTGSPVNLTDSAATNSSRFYRVRVQ